MVNFIPIQGQDLMVEIARPSNNISGMSSVNKFGRSTNVDNGVATDIWDGANATDDVDIWVAPIQARVHNIASSSASDDGNPVGVGARTLRVFGLTDWDTEEVSEDVTLNGTSDVATTNSYVIIHRMEVLTKGATSSNVGAITATAVTDGTVTAQINANNGQTLMAIYGIPSGLTLYLTCAYANLLKAGSTGFTDVSVLYNPEPDSELTNFLTKHTFGPSSTGASLARHEWKPYKVFEGPGILKIQGIGSANNLDVSAGFDGILAKD